MSDSGGSIPLPVVGPDRDALATRIVGEYGGRIRHYLRGIGRHGGSPVAFDEVVGEAFLACEGMTAVDDLWPAILGVLRASGARLKQLERRERPIGKEADAGQAIADDRGNREELWEWEDAMLRLLPARQRCALEWHVMDELDDAAIAASLRVPVDRVRVLRHRASVKCRRFVASGRIPPPPESAQGTARNLSRLP
jgi:hypothetical protein